MDKVTESPAMQLLSLVWGKSLVTIPHSWKRLNHSMWTALSLAISSGMEFAADDVATIYERFDGGYWFGADNDHSHGEGAYTAAVGNGNLSAARSFETWKKRKPFIHDGVTPSWRPMLRAGRRGRGRLALGFGFAWQGESVKVTSFAEDGSHLTACSYKDQAEGVYVRKIARRYKITVADLRADRKARRDFAKAQEELEATPCA